MVNEWNGLELETKTIHGFSNMVSPCLVECWTQWKIENESFLIIVRLQLNQNILDFESLLFGSYCRNSYIVIHLCKELKQCTLVKHKRKQDLGLIHVNRVGSVPIHFR